jgi:hypothetical protein
MSTKKLSLEGERYGRLTVISEGEHIGIHTAWICRCDCGATRLLKTKKLRVGHTKSCGCLYEEKTKKGNPTHGLARKIPKLHHVWTSMRQRCINPRDKGFKNYGGRGISVVPEWNDFKAFYEWAISRGYENGLTIERIDNDGHYGPDNCCWIPNGQQRRNNRRVVKITYRDKTQLISEWSKETGIKLTTLYARFRKGLSLSGIFKELPQGERA